METIRFQPDLVEQVHRSLLAAICTGELAPGQRLTQEQLAAEFAISRQPVVQALRILKAEGFVVDAPKRGVVVTPLDPAMIRNVYQVRTALDALAARLCAARVAKGAPRMDASLVAAGRSAAKRSAMRALIDADIAFHHALYAASGNPMIAEAAQRHWAHIQRAMGGSLAHASVRDKVWDEHAGILAAVNQGDPATAERLASDHGLSASHVLVAHLESVPRVASQRPGALSA